MRRELEDAGAGWGNVLSPAKPQIEFLRALDIRHRDDNCFELHVHGRHALVELLLSAVWVDGEFTLLLLLIVVH